MVTVTEVGDLLDKHDGCLVSTVMDIISEDNDITEALVARVDVNVLKSKIPEIQQRELNRHFIRELSKRDDTLMLRSRIASGLSAEDWLLDFTNDVLPVVRGN